MSLPLVPRHCHRLYYCFQQLTSQRTGESEPLFRSVTSIHGHIRLLVFIKYSCSLPDMLESQYPLEQVDGASKWDSVYHVLFSTPQFGYPKEKE